MKQFKGIGVRIGGVEEGFMRSGGKVTWLYE
jgi:hypothetical protein